MKISKRITAAAVSGVMAVISTAGYTAIAADNGSINVNYTIAADSVAKIYDADAQITVGEVKGKVGETVSVPVYLSIPKDDFITGVAFKALYDKNALELTGITEPYESGLSSGTMSTAVNNAIFCYTWKDADIKVDSSKPICYFTFKIKNGASGEYSVKLVNHLTGDNTKPIEVIHKQEVYKPNTYFDPSVTYGSVTVESGTATTAPTDDKVYDGTVKIRVEKDVKAAVDQVVDVPVYMELGSDVEGKFITGVGFKAVYDNKLELVSIVCPDDGGLDGGFSSQSVPHGIFCYTWDSKDITVDPSKPVCILKFRPKEGANGSYDIKLVNHLTGNASDPIEVIHKQELYKPNTYLTPVVTNGSVVVSGTASSSTAKNDDPTKSTQNTQDTPNPTNNPGTGEDPAAETSKTPTTPVKPTDSVNYDLLYWGDVNLDEYVDLADVVVLSQYLLSSSTFPLKNSTAWENADCKYDGEINTPDLSKLIEYNMGTISIDDLGPSDPTLRRKAKRYQ